MPTLLPRPKSPASGERELTGRFVLFCVLGFFGVIIAVNLTMARLAISTFGGVETRNAYSAGLAFAREAEESRQQDALGWKIDARVERREGGRAQVTVVAADAAGAPLGGLEPVLVFRHPTDARRDREVVMSAAGGGLYTGEADLPAGLWDIRLELLRGGERLFRSSSKLMVP